MKKFSIVLCILFAFTLLFTRFYNLDRTARFTEDEASDLRRMHDIYVDTKLTLVGPISNDKSKVFSSLTYYMLLPFAVIGGFLPVAPVYGTAFWGVLTALLLVWIIYKLNPRLLMPAAVLAVVWNPLLETSRWAWNPHYILFWIAFGIASYLTKFKYSTFICAVALGLAFHHHYLAIFATGTFIAIECFKYLKTKDYKKMLAMGLGFILPFVPFVIFDLRHPPGLFFGKYLLSGSTPHVVESTPFSGLEKLWENIWLMLTHIAPVPLLAGIIGILMLFLIVRDFKTKKSQLLWLLPVIAQIIPGAVLDNVATRYLLAGYVFLFIWLFLKRTGAEVIVQKLIIALIVISSLAVLPAHLTETNVPPDMYSVTQISNKMEELITSGQAKNANIALVASDPLAVSFREYLSLKNVPLKAASEYDATESLFVVTTSDLESIRQDKSAAISYFQKTENVEVFSFPKTEWKLFWFRF